MLRPFRIIRYGLYLALAATLIGAGAGAGVWFYITPQLPSIEILKDMRLQVPLRVYTQDGRLIAEFGEKRRVPVTLRDVPETMVQAVLAAEDDRFYQHPGVDWQGLVRAAWHLLKTGKKG
ncbi:MAG: peptidase, partial [Proteobacteria bacterium]|nr:peptidase [Pseudomonadota bacterium]